MKKLSKTMAVLLAGVLTMGVAAGCSKSTSGGATKEVKEGETVKIGGLFDITGGTGDVGTPYAEGEKAYVEYVNSKGGVDGHKIKLIGEDYAYKIPEAQKLYQKYKSSDGVSAILGWGTADTEALRQQVATDKLPFFSASYSENLKDIKQSPYNFLTAASYSDQARTVLKWIKDNHKGGTPKVALIYNDTAFGKSPIQDAKDFAKSIGVEIVDEQIVDLKALDATSQLLNMQKKTPDYAIINQTWGATSTILKDAKKLNLKTQFIGLNWATGEGLVKIAGDAAEGFIGVVTHAFPYEKDLKGMKEVEEYLKSKGETLDSKNQKFIQGWVTAKILAEGIKNADKLTGEGIREGIEKINNLDLGGLAANVTFSKDSHAGADKVRLAKVQSGKFEVFTDYIGYK